MQKKQLAKIITHILLYTCCNNFLSQVIFIFLLFLGMVMYANKDETKQK